MKRQRRFIDYRESFAFAGELDGWLTDVRDGLLETDAEATLGLLDNLIRLDERIFGRVDDSSGAIGDTFRQACRMWHLAASKLPASTDWVERIFSLHADNDYGVRDGLLDEAALRLSEIELRRLAKMYEKQARAPQICAGKSKHDKAEAATRSNDSNHNWAALSAATAMGQVAVALQDAALFEKSLHIRSPRLNSLQAVDVAKKYVAFGPVEKAIPLLKGALMDNHRVGGQLDLLAEAYEKLGNQAKLRETRRQLFEYSVSSKDFAAYLACLPEVERAKAKESVIAKVVSTGNPFTVAQFLLDIGHSESAAHIVETASDGLIDTFYADLLALAKGFEKAKQFLPTVLCYRALNEQILKEARSKAYGHASRYVAKLAALHPQLDDYSDFPDHEAYMAWLREQHGRKHAFWKRVKSTG